MELGLLENSHAITQLNIFDEKPIGKFFLLHPSLTSPSACHCHYVNSICGKGIGKPPFEKRTLKKLGALPVVSAKV